MTPGDTPALQDVIRFAFTRHREDFRVMIPARVVRWSDSTPEEAEIQPTVRLVERNPQGVRLTYMPRAIPRCPIQWPGGGDYAITWPLSRGDTGMLVFADRALVDWLLTGNDDVDPTSVRLHNYNDGVFVPGLRPYGGLPSNSADGSAMVIRGDEIRIGDSTASQWAVRASDLLARMNALESAFDAHSHLYIQPAPPYAGGTIATTGNPSFTQTTLGQIRATKVKVE